MSGVERLNESLVFPTSLIDMISDHFSQQCVTSSSSSSARRVHYDEFGAEIRSSLDMTSFPDRQRYPRSPCSPFRTAPAASSLPPPQPGFLLKTRVGKSRGDAERSGTGDEMDGIVNGVKSCKTASRSKTMPILQPPSALSASTSFSPILPPLTSTPSASPNPSSPIDAQWVK